MSDTPPFINGSRPFTPDEARRFATPHGKCRIDKIDGQWIASLPTPIPDNPWMVGCHRLGLVMSWAYDTRRLTPAPIYRDDDVEVADELV